MNILGLPENIFLNLFLYFEDNDVYFTLRSVCRRFRMCANAYIKLEAKFFLISDSAEIRRASFWILYFFRKNQIISPF